MWIFENKHDDEFESMTYLGFVYYGIWYDLCDLPLDDIHYKSVMLSWLCGLYMEVVLIYRFVLMD